MTTLGIYIGAARSRSPNLAKNAEFLLASGLAMMSAPPMGERPGGSSWASAATTPWQTDAFHSARREASQRHIEARRRNCLLKQLTQGDADAELNAGCSSNRSGALRLVMPGRAGKAQARLVGPAPWLTRSGGVAAA